MNNLVAEHDAALREIEEAEVKLQADKDKLQEDAEDAKMSRNPAVWMYRIYQAFQDERIRRKALVDEGFAAHEAGELTEEKIADIRHRDIHGAGKRMASDAMDYKKAYEAGSKQWLEKQ